MTEIRNYTELAEGSAIVADFLRYCVADLVRAPVTARCYASDLRHFIGHLKGNAATAVVGDGRRDNSAADLLLLCVDRPAVDAYIAYMDRQRYSSPTIHRHCATLRLFYAWAARRGHVVYNPTAGARPPGSYVTAPRVWLDAEQVDRLRAGRCDTINQTRERAIVELVLMAGVGRQDLLRMNVVDVRAGTISIGPAIRPRHRAVRENVTATVAAYVDQRRAAGLGDDCPVLWINKYGHPIDGRSVNRGLAMFGAAAGVDGLNLRALRNTHIVWRLLAGESPRDVADDLGLLTTSEFRSLIRRLPGKRAA